MTAARAKDALRKLLEQRFPDDAEAQRELSAAIAKFTAATVREDRANRSLFGIVFGDRR